MKKLLAILFLLWASPALAVNCFAVSSGQITPANATIWSSSSGGAGSTCAAVGGVPIAADTANFDGNSGSYTLNWGGTWSVGGINLSGGAVDNSVNNNPISTGGFVANGTTARSWNCGTSTLTMTSNSGFISANPATNFTLTCTNGFFVTTGSSNNTITINLGGLTTWGTFTLGPTTSQSGSTSISSSGTMKALIIQVPQRIFWGSGTTTTITNAVSWTGGVSGQTLMDTTSGSPATIALTAGGSGSLNSIRSISFTGGAFTCLNCATSNVTGVTQTFSGASSPPCIIGGELEHWQIPKLNFDNVAMNEQ